MAALTVAVAASRLFDRLYRRALSGPEFMAGVSERLRRGDRDAALRACEAAAGAPLAEVLRAGIEALPGGLEAVEIAVDEAMLDWRPDVFEGERTLAVLGRVSGLTGLLVGALSVGRAFRHAGETEGSLREAVSSGFGTALAAVAIGVSAMVLAIFSKGILRRASQQVVADLEKASNLLIGAAAAHESHPEDS